MVVVGAGAFGGWTALSLREMGVPVTLVDAYGPGNSRASSGGETRQIRAGYEDRELYTRWVLDAFGRWKAREAEWGRRLFYETGRLLLAPEWNHGLETTKAALDKYKVPNERLTPDELRRRHPQMSTEGVGRGALRAHDRRAQGARRLHRGGGGLPEEGRPLPDRRARAWAAAPARGSPTSRCPTARRSPRPRSSSRADPGWARSSPT